MQLIVNFSCDHPFLGHIPLANERRRKNLNEFGDRSDRQHHPFLHQQQIAGYRLHPTLDWYDQLS